VEERLRFVARLLDGEAKLCREFHAKPATTHYARRQGSVDEVAATYLFLVSEDAGFSTGQTIHVNGGAHYYCLQRMRRFQCLRATGRSGRVSGLLFALFLYTISVLGDVRCMSWCDVERLNDQGHSRKDEGRALGSAPPRPCRCPGNLATHAYYDLTTHDREPHSVKGLGNWMAATIA
jgi:hypothetical protein